MLHGIKNKEIKEVFNVLHQISFALVADVELTEITNKIN